MEGSGAAYTRINERSGDVPLLRVRAVSGTAGRQSENLSASLFYGFDAVLNAREHAIGIEGVGGGGGGRSFFLGGFL